MKGINLGEKNGMWKGDNISRRAIHPWLTNHYGKPNICEICGKVGDSNIDWAKIKDKEYERKRENFWRLCHKCHLNYDNVPIRNGFKKGHIPWIKGKKIPYKPKPWPPNRISWNKGLLGFQKGHPAYNTKPNSGSFKKGIVPTNKGKKFVNGHYV
jgi:hypothetical protein